MKFHLLPAGFSYARAIAHLMLFLLGACQNSEFFPPGVTFEAPLKGKNFELDHILGREIILKTEADSLHLRISSTRISNLILEISERDTFFVGSVVQYKELFFFNQRINDSAYWIYAVKFSGNLAYGLGRGWEQSIRLNRLIDSGEYLELIKKQNGPGKSIQLYSEREMLYNAFTAILNTMKPDTLISAYRPDFPLDSNLIFITNNPGSR